MSNSVYKVLELVGTSKESWEDAAKSAVAKAGESIRDLRVAEIVEFDMTLEDNQIAAFRARIKVSFKIMGAAYDD